MTFKFLALNAMLLILALGAMPAQAQSVKLQVDVPFQFEFNGTQMPAGTYLLAAASSNGLVRLVSAENKAMAAFALGQISTTQDLKAPRLIFRQTGGMHYLRQAWVGGGAGYEFQPPRTGHTAIRAASTRDEVILLAKRVD